MAIGSTATKAAGSPSRPIDLTSRIAPRAPKRSIAPIVGGLLIIFVFALVFGVAAVRSGHREAVLVLSRTVPAGSVITNDDIRVAHIASDGNIKPILATHKNDAVGHTASVTLLSGTLLSASQLESTGALKATDSIVGVALKAGRFPPNLAVGSTVRVVQSDTSGNQTLVDRATVTSIGSPDANNGNASVVSLRLPVDNANAVVGAASASQVSLIEISGQS